jgi:hypothetical protein
MMSQDNRLMPLPSVERALDKPLSDLSRSYGPAATEPSQIRDYLFVILKRKWLILSLCLVVTSLVAIQMFRQPSIYEGEATIRIEQRSKSVFSTDKFVLNAQPDANFWGTQIILVEHRRRVFSMRSRASLDKRLRRQPPLLPQLIQGWSW